MLTLALAAFAIVTQDQVALRAAPRDSAPQQAMLWRGDSLEIRGEKGDFLQVYDHRRERAGYIRATQARPQGVEPESAPELLAVVRFLRDTPGAESLGIAYAAAYLKAAPAEQIDGEIFDALGAFAERLARRGSGAQGKSGEGVAAHLEVAAAYGIAMQGIERDGQVQLCYEGEAHRRVLALRSTEPQKAQAALALTRHECVSPDLPPLARLELDTWRAELLDRVDLAQLSEVLKNRVRMRRAGVWAGLAWQRARHAEPEAAARAGQRALDELAAVNKSELTEGDTSIYAEAGARVGASRWAAEAGPVPKDGKLSLAVTPGAAGESCVHLTDVRHDAGHALFSRCTYGIVWPASFTVAGDGTVATLAVQPLDSWRELWVFRKEGETWALEVLPPAASAPAVGYIEFAGWVPGNELMLVAREARTEGRYRQSFESLKLPTLTTDRAADRPEHLTVFYRWQSPAWKARAVAVR